MLALAACGDGESPSAVCPGTTSSCGTACVDLATDRDNCGECGNECEGLGKGCFAGQCTSPAPMNARRALHALVAGPDGKLYAIGGQDLVGPVATVEAYDPAANRWSLVTPLNLARTVLSAVRSSGQVLAIGGVRAGNSAVSRVESYDVGDDSWGEGPQLRVPRADAAAVTDEAGVVRVFWGWNVWATANSVKDSGGPAWQLGSMESLVEGADWELHEMLDGPPARWGARAVLGPGGKIYFLGGYRSHWFPVGSVTSDVNIFDTAAPAGDEWEHGASMLMPRALGAATLGPDGRIYYFGGVDDKGGTPGTADVQVYDPVHDAWAILAAPLPLPQRDMAAALLSDGRIYVVGGLVYLPDGITSAVVVYDPKRGEWFW